MQCFYYWYERAAKLSCFHNLNIRKLVLLLVPCTFKTNRTHKFALELVSSTSPIGQVFCPTQRRPMHTKGLTLGFLQWITTQFRLILMLRTINVILSLYTCFFACRNLASLVVMMQVIAVDGFTLLSD